jgi:hypothetical protein
VAKKYLTPPTTFWPPCSSAIRHICAIQLIRSNHQPTVDPMFLAFHPIWLFADSAFLFRVSALRDRGGGAEQDVECNGKVGVKVIDKFGNETGTTVCSDGPGGQSAGIALLSRRAVNCRARGLGSNCEHVDKRTCFSSLVSAWGVQGRVFRLWPVRDICMRTVSGEIDKVYAIVLSEAFESSWRIDRIAASVSCRWDLPACP